MRIFLDTNVLLDFVQDGRPNNETVKLLLDLINKQHQEAYVTTQSILDLVYVGTKIDYAKTMFFVNYMLNRYNVLHIDYFSLKLALEDGNPDIEDSAQIACAEDEECDVFLTSDAGILSRNITCMRVMTPEAFINKLKSGSE
ncbi:MAG: PIN domain-containing protein [Bacteroidales bacterium]|nr:PIN domain-containing protein [Bacteroidales bacterium]